MFACAHAECGPIPDLVWLKDKDGVYHSPATPCSSVSAGRKEADIIGRTDYDFVSKELADSFREHDLEAAAAGKPTSSEEWLTFCRQWPGGCLTPSKTPMYDAEVRLSACSASPVISPSASARRSETVKSLREKDVMLEGDPPPRKKEQHAGDLQPC
jgi:hypothetical protein